MTALDDRAGLGTACTGVQGRNPSLRRIVDPLVSIIVFVVSAVAFVGLLGVMVIGYGSGTAGEH